MSHFCVEKLKKWWKFNCKYWIKKLIYCCFSQNVRKHKLTAYLMYLFHFFSNLYKYLNRYWTNQLDIFIITSTKKTIFSYRLISKNMKDPMQIKRSKYYSLMLLSKNQLYKQKTQINKVPTISKYDDIARVLFQVFLHAILMSEIYFCVIIMVGFWFANTRGLLWGIMLSCFESFSYIFWQWLEQGYDF